MDLQKTTEVKPKTVLLGKELTEKGVRGNKVPSEKPLAKSKVTKSKAKAKVTKQTAKDKKVTQTVTVNVSTAKGKGRARKTKSYDPNPKFNEPTLSTSIASRVPLVNTNINNVPTDKNIVADPIKYLESSNINPETKVAVKLKKGQNLYDVETEAQQGAFEAVPTAKGKGLAENVEGQTAIKIQVDKGNKTKSKLNLEPVQQFVQIYGGNTDKVIADDIQAEGQFEKNAEEGMEVTSKRGRPKKYATKEEAKEAKRIQTDMSKGKKELKAKGIATEGYAKGTIPAEVEGEEMVTLLQPKISDLSKPAQRYLTSILTDAEAHRQQEKERRKMFLEGESFANKKFVDRSLAGLFENQFDDSINYANNTNNNPVVQSLNENVTEFPDSNNALTVARASASYTVI